MVKVRARHDRIVSRLCDAAYGKWTIFSENKVVGSGGLRPDLVLVKGKEMLIVDVAMPFENGPDAFWVAREEKLRKYAGLVDELKGRYDKVSVEPVIVGALGSWDPRNDKFLGRICSRKYARLMKKLIVSDTVRASRNIFFEHVSNRPQVDTRDRYRRIAPLASVPSSAPLSAPLINLSSFPPFPPSASGPSGGPVTRLTTNAGSGSPPDSDSDYISPTCRDAAGPSVPVCEVPPDVPESLVPELSPVVPGSRSALPASCSLESLTGSAPVEPFLSPIADSSPGASSGGRFHPSSGSSPVPPDVILVPGTQECEQVLSPSQPDPTNPLVPESQVHPVSDSDVVLVPDTQTGEQFVPPTASLSDGRSPFVPESQVFPGVTTSEVVCKVSLTPTSKTDSLKYMTNVTYASVLQSPVLATVQGNSSTASGPSVTEVRPSNHSTVSRTATSGLPQLMPVLTPEFQSPDVPGRAEKKKKKKKKDKKRPSL